MARERITDMEVTPGGVALTILATSVGMAVLWWAREVFIPIVLSVLIKPVGELLGE
jgi:hypothetical protein